jgi:hypothetical protein
MKRRIRLFAQILILLMLGMIGLGILGTASAAEQATTTEAVHFTKLVSFLPDAPSGWEGEEPEGMIIPYMWVSTTDLWCLSKPTAIKIRYTNLPMR